MTDYYIISVDDNGDVFANVVDPIDHHIVNGLTVKASAGAHDNQGDSNHSKVDAATECLAAIMPEIEDAGEDA